MKNLLIGSLFAISTAGVAQENKTYKHCFSPKAFYRYHNEQNYQFKTFGMGFEYALQKPQGINLKISGLTNFKSKNILVETENTLFFRIPVLEKHNIYPVISSKFSSHKINEVNSKSVFVNKSTAYVGMGWEVVFNPVCQIRAEASFFRDLHNALMVQEADDFWGKSYSNPRGGKVKIGLTTQWKNQIFLEVDGFYARTIEKCYKECGTEIAFRWGF